MTRVLVVSDLWPPFPGGAERLMFNLSRDLARRGLDVAVLTGYEHAQTFDGPPVAQLWLPGDEHAERSARELRAWIDMLAPDVIVTHHHYAWRFESTFDKCVAPWVQIVLNGCRYPGAAFAVYITDWVQQLVGGARPGDFVLTPPAFDDVIAPEHGDAIGFIKPIPHKGVETFNAIVRRMPERQFVVLRGEWRDIEVVKHRRNVTFVDPVVDMRDFYARVRMMLMPSLSEDAGTVAQEATVNGLPCISSNVEGLNETNGGGIRLDPLDVDAWVSTIERFDDPQFCADIVQSQRAHLDTLDHRGGLDRFAAAIERLAS